ncbi:hypothetical protein Tcan_15496 [Toxocara canis]|uniref:Uncharacterized protein n=1 Tax=Toxocara canis TaxID=6265 RepID=A0A0B2VMS0_TOXCA|nr:hypothetical protein Tcan_15496 [Toxocara canis]
MTICVYSTTRNPQKEQHTIAPYPPRTINTPDTPNERYVRPISPTNNKYATYPRRTINTPPFDVCTTARDPYTTASDADARRVGGGRAEISNAHRRSTRARAIRRTLRRISSNGERLVSVSICNA